jgi:hypothetical protein
MYGNIRLRTEGANRQTFLACRASVSTGAGHHADKGFARWTEQRDEAPWDGPDQRQRWHRGSRPGAAVAGATRASE